ncbi:hypothetical protein [Alkalibacillus haloalkaliphilus]|uniref:hypothetical protein n=1 Tax=Alkalibacillus haloalkaliphilus TaxID=94136 RepID=UPI00293622FC|nr:hypothetical protein [Alkalibacillus haloalkaliphilus]MDV2580914.1 hypothetical protein [Alkalibacillus haloalkaliphilus]
MECLCDEKKTNDIKVEGDVGADPFWCYYCECNLDLEESSISIELREELMKWILKYGEWINWSNDEVVSNGVELEEEHNRIGSLLTEKVKKELGDNYKISFSPSTFAKSRSH